MKPARVSGRYRRCLSRLRTSASSRSRATTTRPDRLHLTGAHTHSTGLRSGAQAGSRSTVNPLRAQRSARPRHGRRGCSSGSRPQDRRLDKLVDAVDERDEVPLAHAATLASAGRVGAQSVAQPSRAAHRSARPPKDIPNGARPPSRPGWAAPAPGPSPGRPASEPCLVLETDLTSAGRPGTSTSAHAVSSHTGHRRPCPHGLLVALGHPPRGHLRAEAEPVHQPSVADPASHAPRTSPLSFHS